MTEPDELYTLRAQYWLAHYTLAIEEAKSVARRPMSLSLKLEREEFLYRSQLALKDYDKVIAGTAGSDSTALQALGLSARYSAPGTSEEDKATIVEQLKSFIGEPGQLYAAHVFLDAGLTKEALQCVHIGVNMEQIALSLQIYIKIDRLDLAKQQLNLLKQADEDAVLTQLGSVYISLATGSSTASDALHSLNSLMEQYGPSPFLLNLAACAHMQGKEYAAAEKRLEESLTEFPDVLIPDTIINMIVCSQHLGKSTAKWITQMKTNYPNHAFCAALDRVVGAFDREMVKYRV